MLLVGGTHEHAGGKCFGGPGQAARAVGIGWDYAHVTVDDSCHRSHHVAAVAEAQGLTLWRTQPYRAALRLDRGTVRLPAGLPALLQRLPTAWRPGRRHGAGQTQVNNLVMQNSQRPLFAANVTLRSHPQAMVQTYA